jgi:RNA polymerase sigma factor (sigma-70 family)
MFIPALALPMENQGKSSIDWAQAIEDNRRWLATVVHSRLADRQAAEDVIQEIALAVLRQSSRPSDPSKIAPWLYRIALRKVINHHRAAGRRKRLLERTMEVGQAQAVSTEQVAGEWLMKVEQETALAKGLEQLDPQDRQILLLKYTEGWGYQELSDHLGITIKTVEYRLLKARKALRARMSE